MWAAVSWEIRLQKQFSMEKNKSGTINAGIDHNRKPKAEGLRNVTSFPVITVEIKENTC